MREEKRAKARLLACAASLLANDSLAIMVLPMNEHFCDRDLQENEEIREAMEGMVGAAVVSLWGSMVQNGRAIFDKIHGVLGTILPTEWMQTLQLCYEIPDLQYYEDDTMRLLLLLALGGVLYGLYNILCWRKTRSYSAGPVNANVRGACPLEDIFIGSDQSTCDDNASQDDDKETDEDRFQRNWPTSISQSDYNLLVLPPTCRFMKISESKARAVIANRKRKTPTSREDEDKHDEITAPEDDPLARLQSYWCHFLVLVKSILSYDYAGAGRMLITWLQGIQRQRRIRLVDIEDDMSGPLDECQSESYLSMTPSNDSLVLPEVSILSAAAPRLPSLKSKRNNEEEKKDEGNVHPMDFSPAVPQSRTQNGETRRDSGEVAAKDGSFLFSTSDMTNSSSDPLVIPEEYEVPVARTNWRDSHILFKTVSSPKSLKELAVQVALPDKNGYIVGEEYLPSTRHTPLLVFVNSRSGSQQGHLLIMQLRRLLNPIQVWDLADGGPRQILESFCVFSRLRILVCGGDGTVSWIFSTLEDMDIERKWPPIAILPLGTGNDLARVHGWGGGYNNEPLTSILKQVSESYVSMLDRWELSITETSSKNKKKVRKEVKNFFNYLGVGVDAQTALQVHNLRNSRPTWFFSRVVNKAMYGIFGAEDMITASSVHIRKEIKLIADGVVIPLPEDSQGIILLNIDSYAGGVPLWAYSLKPEVTDKTRRHKLKRSVSLEKLRHMPLGRSRSFETLDDMMGPLSDEQRYSRVTACDRQGSCQDGLLDVVSVRGTFHLGQIRVGLSNAQKLCQCKELTIIIKNKAPIQIDGEPWRQTKCKLHIRRKGSAAMLHRSVDDGGIETEMAELLEWAENRRLIDTNVHSILLNEYSRRVESKKRRLRDRPNNIVTTLKKVISENAITAVG